MIRDHLTLLLGTSLLLSDNHGSKLRKWLQKDFLPPQFSNADLTEIFGPRFGPEVARIQGKIWDTAISCFCIENDPVLTMQPFTSNVSCPVNKVDYIESEVTLNMTGVDGSLWKRSISIKDSNGQDMIQANFGSDIICGPIENNFFHCYEKDGDLYYFKYRLDSQATYSGNSFSAVILSHTFRPIWSNWQIYPVTKDGQLQFLTINGETKSWRKGAQIYTVKKVEKLAITYNVTGISHTASHRISIQGSDKKELISSSTELAISSRVQASEGTICVSYVADACNQTTEVQLMVNRTAQGKSKASLAISLCAFYYQIIPIMLFHLF